MFWKGSEIAFYCNLRFKKKKKQKTQSWLDSTSAKDIQLKPKQWKTKIFQGKFSKSFKAS